MSNTRIVLATVVSSLLQSLEHCRCSIDVIRHITHRYARWQKNKESGSVRDESNHLRPFRLLDDMLVEGETAELILHWNELTSKQDMVAALLSLSLRSSFNQVEAEALATQCQQRGFVVVASFSCEVWKSALAATRSEEAEVSLDMGGQEMQLLAGLDLLAVRDMILSVRPMSLKIRLDRGDAMLSWLKMLASSCDGMKRLVCESLDRNKLTVKCNKEL